MTAIASTPHLVASVAMRADTSQTALVAGLTTVKGALPARPYVPIMAGVLIEGHGNYLTVSAFDYENSITRRITGSGIGRVVVNGLGLLDKVKDLAKGCPLTLQLIAGKVHVHGDGVTYKLDSLPLDDYPQLPAVLGAVVATINPTDLARVPDVTMFAGVDDTLPVLTAVQVAVTYGRVEFTATDRYRLGRLVIDAGVGAPTTMLMPAKALTLAAKTVFRGQAMTIIKPAANLDYIILKDNDTTMTVRLMEGGFPRTASLWPTEFACTADVPTKVLAVKVKQISKVLDRNAPVRIVANDLGVVVASGLDGTDQAESDPIDSTVVAGEDTTVAFNPAFLLSMLGALGGERTLISMVNDSKPATFVDPARPGLTVLLMPVRQSH